MALAVPVDDPEDERLADYVRITDAELRRRAEVFLCEGVLVIRRALATGTTLRSVLLTPARWAALADELAAVDIPAYVLDQDMMSTVTGFNIHRGAIAAAVRPAPPPLDHVLATSSTVVVLEGVNDSENLGALFRNAAAFGVGAVLLDPTTADPLYRRSVRVSLGHVLGVPQVRLADWPGDLTRVRAAGFELVGLTPAAEAEPLACLDAMGRVAILLGAEGPGLSPAALAHVDRRIRIPMAPGVDSLNVATAAAVALHHRFTPA